MSRDLALIITVSRKKKKMASTVMLLAEYVTHIFDVTTETAGRLYDVGVNESRPGDTFYLSLAFLGLSVSFIRVKTGASPQYCIFTSPGVYS